MIYGEDFKKNMPGILFDKVNFIRKLGNQAAHNRIAPSSEMCLASVRNLYFFFKWLIILYSDNKPYFTRFREEIIEDVPKSDKSLQDINRLEEDYFRQQKELLRIEKEIDELKERFRRTERIKSESWKSAYENKYSSDDHSEHKTRELFIDLLLIEAGWDPKAENVEEFEVVGMPVSTNPTGTGYVDYVLWGDNGLPLAVVEAKKTMIDAHKGQHQAELYANCLEKMTGQRPVIFYSNGYEHWIWDDLSYTPRQIQGFYTHDELQLLINRRETKENLKDLYVNKKVAGRYYQEEAIRRVTETFESKNRGALLVMATGSGKTRTAAALVEMLTKANWVKNILFLADRNALVTQAKNAFKEHLPKLNGIDLTKEKEDHLTRLVFSTYPTIMNKIDSVRTGDQRFYSPGHFDLIIIDEAHRSVYMKYKAIFEYFDSLLLGLTATPKAEVDKNTYELFGLETHDPTYAYELDKAVDDKYLNPPKAMSVPLKFPREGIKYADLSDDDKAKYEMTFRDEESGQMPEEIDAAALYSWLFNRDTIDRMLEYTMINGLKVEGGNKLGKAILFATSHKHALYIEERFNKMFPQYRGKFLRVIDNYESKAESLLDDFSSKHKYPQIAVSVDMLDTGIDIHEIINLVFFKRVRSSSKFWQMIGRGTRLCEDLFGPGRTKSISIFSTSAKTSNFLMNSRKALNPVA
ncbi:MAG: DEAD/DEAH box helicase family protein [Bacteroidota bacterium]|nr:DEAD/DEAH box helicase family protein [Bacteroidota bacterium]